MQIAISSTDGKIADASSCLAQQKATSGGQQSLDSLQNRMGAIENCYCQILLFAFVMGINDDDKLCEPHKSIK